MYNIILLNYFIPYALHSTSHASQNNKIKLRKNLLIYS